ncbi:MAG: hypothetical protein ACI8TA_003104 [Cyclobacteriaceae bacterium]
MVYCEPPAKGVTLVNTIITRPMPHTKKLLLHNRDQQIRHELNLNNQDIEECFKIEKFQKMAESPYAFYRGSNHLYWADFYNDWRINFFGGTSSTLTWINGDAHIYNYGAYANHYGEAIFCMDDFDDAIVADYQFDLWRMAISLLLDCRNNGVFGEIPQKKALNTFAGAYLKEMTAHKDDDPQNEVHLTKNTATGLLHKFLKRVEKKKSRLKMLDKWTNIVDGKRVFDTQVEKLERLSKDEYTKVEKAILEYRSTLGTTFEAEEAHFEVKDIARRVKAGTGSLGSARYYILLEGDTASADDDVILDMKAQGKPPLYSHMNKDEKSEYDENFPNEGERHARAYRALAEHPDKYLGWISMDDMTFSVKERSPFKCDFPSTDLKKNEDLFFMSDAWGRLLASRHKRASYILNSDAHEMPIAVKEMSEEKKRDFKSLVSSIALTYADRVAQDYGCFIKMLGENENAQ